MRHYIDVFSWFEPGGSCVAHRFIDQFTKTHYKRDFHNLIVFILLVIKQDKSLSPTGLVWDTNLIAAVSLFWNTIMALP